MIQGRWDSNLVASSLAFVIQPSQTMTKRLRPSTEKHSAGVHNHNTVECQPLHHSQDDWNNKFPSEALCLQPCLVNLNHSPEERCEKKIHNTIVLFDARESGNLDKKDFFPPSFDF